MWYSIHIKCIPGSIYDGTYVLPAFKTIKGKVKIASLQFTRNYFKSWIRLNSAELSCIKADLNKSDGIIRFTIDRSTGEKPSPAGMVSSMLDLQQSLKSIHPADPAPGQKVDNTGL